MGSSGTDKIGPRPAYALVRGRFRCLWRVKVRTFVAFATVLQTCPRRPSYLRKRSPPRLRWDVVGEEGRSMARQATRRIGRSRVSARRASAREIG